MASVVQSTFVLAGTVESFDQESFKSNLAAGLSGVAPDDISLIVTAASVSVTATIRTQDATIAESAVQTLTLLGRQELSNLVGVQVESVTSISASTVAFDAPSPPQPPTTPPFISDGGPQNIEVPTGNSGVSTTYVILAAAAITVVVGAIVLACLCVSKKHLLFRTPAAVKPPTRLQNDVVFVRTHDQTTSCSHVGGYEEEGRDKSAGSIGCPRPPGRGCRRGRRGRWRST